MQIVLLSISHRGLCPLAANHFLQTGNVRVSSKRGRRRRSQGMFHFLYCVRDRLAFLLRSGDQLFKFRYFMLFLNPCKNCDFALNIPHDPFLPRAFQFTIHYSFNIIYFDLPTISLNTSYITQTKNTINSATTTDNSNQLLTTPFSAEVTDTQRKNFDRSTVQTTSTKFFCTVG